MLPNDSQMIDAMAKSKASKVFAGKKLSKWFEIDLVIKIFGQTIFSFHYPPQTDSENDQIDS